MGQLEVIAGPMYSGKTEELLRRLRRSKIAGKNVLLLKPQIDDRFDIEVVRSHNGVEMPSMRANSGLDLLKLAEYYDVIGVDEVQFFDESVLQAILYIVRDATVIVSGLDTNFRYEPFGIMPLLLAYAEKVDKLSAICNKCGLEGTKTQRLIDGKPAPLTGPEILVGGLESYEARCRECFEIA